MTRTFASTLAAAALISAGCATETTPTAPRTLRPVAASRDVGSSGTTQIVTPSDVASQAENTAPTKSWVIYTRNGGASSFVAGGASGVGSLQLSTPTGADKVYAFNYDHLGTPLTSITDIAYSTYRVAGSAQQVAALNIEVDYNGPAAGGFTTLVFEPVYNTSQGAVINGTWQRWAAAGSGRWWSTKNIPGVCAFTCYATWSDIVAANPGATILGGFGINQGSGNPGLTTKVDALTLGVSGSSVTYDFEPYRVATTTDECKDGGWTLLRAADGRAFKNQGDCVSYVAAGK